MCSWIHDCTEVLFLLPLVELEGESFDPLLLLSVFLLLLLEVDGNVGVGGHRKVLERLLGPLAK